MNSIIYIGMDVHTTNYTLCAYCFAEDKEYYITKVQPDYKNILKYIDRLRQEFGEDTKFVCGYEAGCLGYSLYYQLLPYGIECIIMAPTTIAYSSVNKKIKTDKRDAALLAKTLATKTYSAVVVPADEDLKIKEYIRMREDQKKIIIIMKQKILAFCNRHGIRYTAGGNWTVAHLDWLRKFELDDIYREILDEYLATLDYQMRKLERLDSRIEEFAKLERYEEKVKNLRCFSGIETYTALAVITEISDFTRFEKATHFASYLGLVPGEHSSSDKSVRTSITKAGNTHIRKLLIEAVQGTTRGSVGIKSKRLVAKQNGNTPMVIHYADKGNDRIKRKYKRMIFKGVASNKAKVAVARELACYIWGMMNDKIY